MAATVLPGELVPAKHVNLKLGPGLLQLSNNQGKGSIISTRAGTLNHSESGNKWWIDGISRRYVPVAQESVIGIVAGRSGEGWRVDIGSAHFAQLDGLAFEGASKRNKPNLKVGSLVFARISLAHKDMDPELECFDAQTRKSEGHGELKGGFMVRCSLQMCRLLLDPKHFLMTLLGALFFPVEAKVGTNGRAWINTRDVRKTIAVARCIEAADPDGGGMDEVGIKKLCSTLEL